MREVVFKSVAVALTVGGAVAGFAEEEILENPAFEQIEADGKAPGWGLSGCFRAVHGEGHNGNVLPRSDRRFARTARFGKVTSFARTVKVC